MQILIIGAGAIGSLTGAKLAEQGAAVTLVGRPAHVDLIRAQGIRLEDETGARQIDTLDAAASIAEALAGDRVYDLAILTVKSYDTATALAELQAAAAHGRKIGRVLSLQNGVGNEEALADALGSERVIAGTITTPVSVPAPGVIRVDRPKYVIGLSDWLASSEQPSVAAVQERFVAAGFAATHFADARGMKWTKLLMNMLGNATSAILDAPPQVIFAEPALVDLEIDAWREAFAVMHAAGIPPQNLDGYPLGRLAPVIRAAPRALLRPVLRRQIGGARGGKMPSLYLDLAGGKGKSEVTWLNGAVVRAGQEVGVAAPVNQALTETLLSLVAEPALRREWRQDFARLHEACRG